MRAHGAFLRDKTVPAIATVLGTNLCTSAPSADGTMHIGAAPRSYNRCGVETGPFGAWLSAHLIEVSSDAIMEQARPLHSAMCIVGRC